MARVTAPGLWTPADGLVLEPHALMAVRETVQSIAMTAGPGAGKTEMLAQRADFLLRTGTCRYPQRILSIAFKKDAAKNLKERVRRRCGPGLAGRLDSYTFHAFARRLIDRFRPVLVGSNALDADYTIGRRRIQNTQITFDDMVPLAIQIIQDCEVARNAVRQTYSYVFLDEFQDCTETQYGLISESFLGFGIPITAVGDYKQRIMVWAGALDGIFETFATDFNAKPLNLYQNFRSLPLLRRMQNAMVKFMDPKAAVPDKDLLGAGGSVSVKQFADAEEEASAIADLITQWIEEGLDPSSIAVLVAKQPELYAQDLIAELESRGLPFRNDQSFREIDSEPAAQLICDFVRVVFGDQQPEAYGRLMAELLQTPGDEAFLYAARAKWHRFIEECRDRARSSAKGEATVALVAEISTEFLVLVGNESLSRLSADYEYGSHLEDVIALTQARIAQLLQIDSDPVAALRGFSEDSAVRIMTIHKSKSLEFDSVIMLGVEKEAYWSDIVEERSGFFVGISRAKRRLVLTACNVRNRPEGYFKRWFVQRSPQQEFLGYGLNAK